MSAGNITCLGAKEIVGLGLIECDHYTTLHEYEFGTDMFYIVRLTDETILLLTLQNPDFPAELYTTADYMIAKANCSPYDGNVYSGMEVVKRERLRAWDT